MRSDHCWSHGRGRPSASFQAGNCTARARAFFDSVTASISSRMRVTLFSGLLLGEAERVHLHAVAEQPLLGVGDAVALARDLVPQFDEGAHLAHFGDEAQAGVDEERNAPDHLAEFLLA